MTKRRRLRITLGAAAAVAMGCLIAGRSPQVPAPVLTAATAPIRVAGSPCTATARACVDLTTKRAWLIRNGRVVFGPVPVNIGGPGEETPRGTFTVWRKDPHHISMQQHGTPMPYSVFFDRGVAFHSGPLELMSAGCVHLRPGDAVMFYNSLRIGDQVQVRVAPRPVAGRPIHPPARTGAVRPRPKPAPSPAHAVAPADPGVHLLPPEAVAAAPRQPTKPVLPTRPAIPARPATR